MLVAVLLAGVATMVVRAGQQQPATYLVEVDAVVTDDDGKPVVGLKQGDHTAFLSHVTITPAGREPQP